MPLIELISYVITLSGLFVVLLLVALKNTHSAANKYFIFFGLSVFFYTAAAFAAEFPESYQAALTLNRTALFAANFVPLFFYSFAIAFTGSEKQHKVITALAYLAIPVLSIVAYLPDTIATVEREYGTTLGEVGPALWATLIYFVILFTISFRILTNYAKHSNKSVQSQVKLMMYGIGFAVTANMITQIILPSFGVTHLGSLIGNPANVILVSGVAAAILKYQMFDIKSAIFRSLGFVITVSIIALGYSTIIFGAGKILLPGLQLSNLEFAFIVLTALLLTLTIRPLLSVIKKITDRLFFRDDYDSEWLVNEVGNILASQIDLRTLTHEVVTLLSQHMRVQTVNIVVLDKSRIYYESANLITGDSQSIATELHSLGDQLLATDDLPTGDKKNILHKYGIAIFAPLVVNQVKIGYFLFSEKNSGTGYNRKDVALIDTVSDQLSIAIHNSLSYSLVRQFNTILQQRINDATEQLRSANDKLKEADSVKDDFISMASHQLTTPLAAIDGYLSMATKGFYGPLPDKLSGPLTSALSRTRVMKQLVIDLLTVSRMTAGKFVLETRPTDMDALVKAEVEALSMRAADSKVTLTYHPPPARLPKIEVDEQKTRQAITNLIDNAVHYTPGGKVDIHLTQNGDRVIFTVIDNGIGVPESQKDKLFTKFFRAENAKDSRPDGTGLGLYLVKRVVDAQNGTIIFHSSPKGSTFGFSLPVKLGQ